MMYVLTILMIIAIIATVTVLGVGIVSMAVGGESNQQHSVQLMSARVSLQAAAILLIVIVALAGIQA